MSSLAATMVAIVLIVGFQVLALLDFARADEVGTLPR